MATRLHKPVSRRVSLSGREWIVTLLPATPESRFDAVVFRPRGCRRNGPASYFLPLESAMMVAAERTRLARIREKKRLKKLKKFGL